MRSKSTFAETFPTLRKIPALFKGAWRIIRFIFPYPGKLLWRARKVLLKVLLGIIVIFAISYGAFDYYASLLVKREYHQIRQQDAPLLFSEVIDKKVPDKDNAAKLYIQAAQELKLPENYYFQITTPQHQKIAIIRNNPKTMPLVERASRLPQCNFAVPGNGEPSESLNPHLGRMRMLARFIRLNAEENARKKNYQQAFQQIGYINLLAERIAGDDTIIDIIVARVISDVALHATSAILQKATLTKSQAQEYLQLLPQLDWHQLLYNALRGERAFNVSSYEYNLADIWNRRINDNDGFDIPDEPSKFKHRGFITRPLLKMEEVYSLRLWQKVLLSAQKPGVINADYETQTEKQLNRLPFYATGTKQTHESFLRIFMNRDYPETHQRQQEIAFALNAYKTERGKYPPTLAQAEQFWGKKFSLDPYTDRPFLYRAEEDDYILYSTGPDRIDNGGTKQPQGKWDFRNITDLIWGDYPL